MLQRRSRWLLVAPILLIGFARPSLLGIVIGLPLVIVGMSLRLWASGHVDKGRSVAATGPYGLMRHPLYLGTIVSVSGWCAMAGTWLVGSLVALYVAAIHCAAMLWEESCMLRRHPIEYAAYLRRVPRFGIRWRHRSSDPFDWWSVRANSELVSAGWIALTAALIAARGWLIN